VVFTLRDEALEILKKDIDFPIAKIHNSVFNRVIKEIGKIAGIKEPIKLSHRKGNKRITACKPKYDWISSNTCRRSFCTNEFIAGTPVELIMKINGHKSLTYFYRYIKISPEEAAEKIKEIWLARGEIQTI